MFATFTPLQSAAESAERLKEGLRETPHNLQEVLKEVADRFFQHLPGVLTGIVIFLFFWVLARLASRLVRKLAERARSDEALRDLLVPLTRFAVLAVGLLMALDQMGFEVSSLLAGVGIAGLAVGLAAQETMANVFAGFTILWDHPYRIGDTVTMAGNQGQVSEIGLRSTRIRTFDQREVILPNREIIHQPIVNHSRSPAMRIDAPVPVAYGVADRPGARGSARGGAAGPAGARESGAAGGRDGARRVRRRGRAARLGGRSARSGELALPAARSRQARPGRGRHRDSVPAARGARRRRS